MNAAIEIPVKLARARCETPVERAPELLDLVVQAATPIVYGCDDADGVFE
jgi:hypothetical protein